MSLNLPDRTILQLLLTVWTKSSRGGQLASQRNGTPEGWTVPSSMIDLKAPAAVQVTFNEPTFTPIVTQVEPRRLPWHSIPFHLERDGQAVTISHANSRFRCELVPQTWARLVWNERHTGYDTGNWWYSKAVLNVGFELTLDTEVFRTSVPTFEHRELKYLR